MENTCNFEESRRLKKILLKITKEGKHSKGKVKRKILENVTFLRRMRVTV
jgi:hypothetical protein